MHEVQLVEQHIIDKTDTRWVEIDVAAFRSKNLYNAANYLIRQEYISQKRYIPYSDLDKLMKCNPDYCALPRKVSQWVLKQVDHDWRSFFEANEQWKINPDKFLGRPKLPKYKHKTEGRNQLTYTVQAVSDARFRKGFIQPSQLNIVIETKQKSFNQVRILPRKTHYLVEVIYTRTIEKSQLNPNRVASIDIGVDNLATVTFNQLDLPPLLVNGRPLKSINHFFNKERARLQSILGAGQNSSKRLDKLSDKRNRRVKHYLHLTSRRLIDSLRLFDIGTLVIGKNDGWKQGVNLGSRNNQNFTQIPHAYFIEMLTYKAKIAGIDVIIVEENYTSKCSFLDNEPIAKHDIYMGKRVKRWLFVASDGREIHADINASFNIMRKVIPNAINAQGIAASVVKPVRITPY